MAEIYRSATEYVANELTIVRGSVANIVTVGVYHDVDPGVIPTVAQFTTVTLIDGVANPSDPLAEAGKIDVLSSIGPKVGADLVLTPGTYQRWVLITTADEEIIRRPDTLDIL